MNALRSLREYCQAVDARGGWQTEERPDEAGDTGVEAGDGGDDVPAESGASRSRTSTRGSTRGKSTQTLTEVIAAVTTSAKKGKAEATSTNTNDPDGRRFDERLRKKFPYGPYVWFENSRVLTKRQKLALVLLEGGATLYGGAATALLRPDVDYKGDFDMYFKDSTTDDRNYSKREVELRKVLREAGLATPTYKHGGPGKMLSSLWIEFLGEKFEAQVSDQAAFEGGLKKQFDGDSFTVEMGDKGLLFFQFHDEVKRDGLKVDSLIDILKRCEQRETRMILDDADVDDSRLLRKTLNKWLHKEELGWKVTVANLSQDVAREVEEVLAYHTNMSKKDIGFRTHKSLLMECMMFQEIADYLIKVDSKLRYVRWLDQDEYVDCCFVPKAAAKDAILPGLVPNLRYKGYCEPAQGKTHRGLSPDPKHIRRIYEKRLLHYGRTIMIWYDYVLDMYIVMRADEMLRYAKQDATPTGGYTIRFEGLEGLQAKEVLKGVYMDPRHPRGEAFWKAHGVSTLAEVRKKLEALWDSGKKERTTFADLISTDEAEEFYTFQAMIGDGHDVQTAQFPCEIVDLRVDVPNKKKARGQAKARNLLIEKNRISFRMDFLYTKDDFDFYLLTIRYDGKIVGMFVLDTPTLFYHRHFPGQLKRNPNENRLTKEPVEITQMQSITIAALEGILEDIPGLRTERPDAVTPELRSFMEDAAKCYFRVDYDRRGNVMMLSPDDHKRLMSILDRAVSEWDESKVRPIHDIPTAKMFFDSGMNKAGWQFALGTRGTTFLSAGLKCGRIMYNGDPPLYNGRVLDGFAKGMIIQTALHGKKKKNGSVAQRKRGEHLEWRFFPATCWFFNCCNCKHKCPNRDKFPPDPSVKYTQPSGSQPYTRDPVKAQQLCQAYTALNVEGAMNELIRTKGPTSKIVKDMLTHPRYRGNERPEILALPREKKGQGDREVVPPRTGEKRKRDPVEYLGMQVP